MTCNRARFRAFDRKLSFNRRADTALLRGGLVSFAKKYMIPDVADVISDHISSQWPTTLSQWDVRAMERAAAAKGEDVMLPEHASVTTSSW